MDSDMEGNLTRFCDFADAYDDVRPSPPEALKVLLLSLAGMPRARIVVDLGSGTGLSTKYWAGAADAVVGIEPNRDMRARAMAVTREGNVTYREGLSTRTGVGSGAADIVTCAQSLHWMEPEPTFDEVARVLREGGVFAAYDCDWPPTTGSWQADLAYQRLMQRVAPLERGIDGENRVKKWENEGHLQRMVDSGRFRHAKEVLLHHVERGNAERFVGLLLSQGGIRALLKAGATSGDLGIDEFRDEYAGVLGPEPREWYWSYRVRIGIR